jgi:hypothetical protein
MQEERTQVTGEYVEVLAQVGVVNDFREALVRLVNGVEKVLASEDERQLLLDSAVV